MTKNLKIRFVKFEIALVMQVLEMRGEFSDSEHVKIGNTRFCYNSCSIDFIFYMQKDNLVGVGYFGKNEQRDEYLNNVIKWISKEQFATVGKLEIGKECEASNDGENWRVRIFAGKLAKELGEPHNLVAYDEILEDFERYKYVRPYSSFVRPKIDGDVYTWEMEVPDER